MTDTLKTISPVDGRIYVERPLETAAGIDRALELARQAQPGWAALPLAARCEMLGRAVDAFVAKANDIAAEITWQMGRPIRHSPGEIRGFEERARYMLGLAPAALAPVQPGDKAGFDAADQARAARRRRRRGTVELSLPDGGQCRAAGADRRQCGGAQALAPDPAVRRALSRGLRRAPACRPACSNTCTFRTPTRHA